MVVKVAVSPDLIHGDVDAGYGKVADAFPANFRDGTEVGAAFAVYRDGVEVVDLWGGYRNGLTKDPWQADTMVNMFSTTKGGRGPGRGDGGVARTHLLRRQGGRLLAGVRAGGKGRCHGPPTFGTPGRAARAETQADAGRRGRTREARADPGRAEAGVATGFAARLPRDHARLVQVGVDPPDRPGRPHARAITGRRDRQAAR